MRRVRKGKGGIEGDKELAHQKQQCTAYITINMTAVLNHCTAYITINRTAVLNHSVIEMSQCQTSSTVYPITLITVPTKCKLPVTNSCMWVALAISRGRG